MGKRAAICFLSGLLLAGALLSGCGASPDDFRLQGFDMESVEENEFTVQLADVDFALVPQANYYILMEEGLRGSQDVFFRRYVRYDGIRMTVGETVQELELPRPYIRTLDAKKWLKKEDPEQLRLLPKTYLSDNVMLQWEQEEYNYEQETMNLISLESLMRMGGIIRTGDDFVIDPTPYELEERIGQVEEDYLPRHKQIVITRELEALPLSLTYNIQVDIHTQPVSGGTPAVAGTFISLSFKMDELGHPFELDLETSFSADGSGIGLGLKEPINDLAAFAWVLRETLVEELRLFGVNDKNPVLDYGNASLSYSYKGDKLSFRERYSIR
jgi:hypothetical protein